MDGIPGPDPIRFDRLMPVAGIIDLAFSGEQSGDRGTLLMAEAKAKVFILGFMSGSGEWILDHELDAILRPSTYGSEYAAAGYDFGLEVAVDLSNVSPNQLFQTYNARLQVSVWHPFMGSLRLGPPASTHPWDFDATVRTDYSDIQFSQVVDPCLSATSS